MRPDTSQRLEETRIPMRSLACVAAIALLVPSAARSEVIGDNRLERFTALPSLGRGYNIQKNSLRSVCFESVKASNPVFDFYYEFENVDADYLQRISSIDDEDWAADRELTELLREHLEEPGTGPGGAAATQTVNIVARITLESYHGTLDESASPVAQSAKTLIEQGRYLPFFESCGFFYVRSIRYSSTFIALFQFTRSTDEKENARFEHLLRTGLFEFGPGNQTEAVERESAARGLKVFIRGAGLGRASQLANLVPTSLKEFRTSIQSAAQLMQVADSGLISSMEVAPWIEHPDVRLQFFKSLAPGESSFGKTHRLELNSQVIAAINEARDDWLEEYYLANLCRTELWERFPVDAAQNASRTDVYDPAKTLFEDHRHRYDPQRRITLQAFRDYFTQTPPSVHLERANRFLRGGDGKEGAEACIAALLKEGLDQADSFRVPSCMAAINDLSTDDRFLQNYCLPTPVTKVYRPARP